MNDTVNADIDLCGIVNLLRSLEGNGFTKAELRKIVRRIAANTGAEIILDI